MQEPQNYQPKNLDAAKRMADAIALHQTALSKDEILAKRFVAIRLADGGSDNTAYDSRAAAIESARNSPSRCAYFQIPLERWGVATCDSLLAYVRGVYDAGNREDPARQLIIPTRMENLRTLT